jgi:hypothetical protein
MGEMPRADRRIEIACAWCGPLGLLLFVVGFWLVAGLLPPPSASESAAGIAHFYRENQDQLRIGLLVSMIATPLLVPFMVLLTLQIRRSDERLAPLAYTQLICGTILVLEILIALVLMAVAAFRPGRGAELTQLTNDAAFTFLLWAFAPPTLEYLAIGAAALLDRSERPIFPRWVGYFDIAVAVIFMAGGPTLFVKGGAFGWDGALALWAVLIAFSVWVWVTFAMMLRTINATAPA